MAIYHLYDPLGNGWPVERLRCNNLTKRQLAAAFTHNLSLLMRHLTGHGTAKQWLAAAGGTVFRAIGAPWAALALVATVWTRSLSQSRFIRRRVELLAVSLPIRSAGPEIPRFKQAARIQERFSEVQPT